MELRAAEVFAKIDRYAQDRSYLHYREAMVLSIADWASGAMIL
jgi:hypothetical protein